MNAMTVSYEAYALRRDANIIAKFVARCLAWEERYYLYKNSGGEFPRAIPKSAKYPAYGAARNIEKTLGLTTHASTVPELAALAGEALKAMKDYSSAA